MEILEGLQELFGTGQTFVKTANYYFERHQCPEGGDGKVMMDYKVKTEKDDKIIKIGQCPVCKIVFYHEDYESAKNF